ncbi:MAG: GGDEF domain-containing protein, partial [Lachnospiraceae bacterium]|nr:GGDEF domain-containing protein [Lachnospiraceae bacterium]
TVLSGKYPMLFLLDNLNMASESTILLLHKLQEEAEGNIFVYGTFNELHSQQPHVAQAWESWTEKLEDENCIVTIGGDEIEVEEESSYFSFEISCMEEYLTKLHNMYYLLDYAQAQYYLSLIYHKIEVEKLSVDEDSVFKLYMLYAVISMYSDMPRALLLCDNIQFLPDKNRSVEKSFWHKYILGQIQMYSGNLNVAKECVDVCREMAQKELDGYYQFMVELLEVMVRMSGWHNIFFCSMDIEVTSSFFEQAQRYGYENHLAYTYIFAYDNDVRLLGESSADESVLLRFRKGIEIAKRNGNEKLLLIAYRKNIMLSSLFGLFHVANLYYYKCMEIVGDKNPAALADIYNGLGYSCCAAEQYEKANSYYNKALVIYYQQGKVEYIGETLYNMATNCMLAGENKAAYDYLLSCMKIINIMHLNDLRVCNISKIFGLLALCAHRLLRRFDTRIYLDNALQFLGHILSRPMEEQIQNRKLDVSYTSCDDDLFLYYYVNALVEMDRGRFDEALAYMESAGIYAERSTGYQFFSMVQYKISLAQLLKKMDREAEANAALDAGERYAKKCGVSEKQDMLRAVREGTVYKQEHNKTSELSGITLQQIHTATKQAGVIKDYAALKKQMEFILAWQKMIDISGKSFTELVQNALNTFMLNFSIDAMVYIRYKEESPQICFDTKQVILSDADVETITRYFSDHRAGFVTSKLKKNYMEYNRIISLFGVTQICSMVCLPYYAGDKLNGVFIAYILMKDNWNAPRTKFMLDESDMEFFNLVLLQLQNSVEKLENEEHIKRINSRLEKLAITDYLTGLYNRDGFYQTIKSWVEGQITQDITFLYIDLDNFKFYNDTFGHAAGDRVLKEVADILCQVSEGSGFAARFGGDEFLISLKFVDKERALAIGRRILDAIQERKGFADIIAQMTGKDVIGTGRMIASKNTIGGIIPKEKELSCSIGIAAMSGIVEDDAIAETISKADEVLYMIKHTTKGDVKYSD